MKLLSCRWMMNLALLIGLSTTAWASLEEAEQAYARRAWAQAATLYAPIVGELGGEAAYRANLQYGDALRRTGQLADAVNAFDAVVANADAPAFLRVRAGRWMALSQSELERHDDAIATLQRLLEIEGQDTATFADTLLQGGDFLAITQSRIEEGLTWYRRVFGLDAERGVGPGWKRISDAIGRVAYAEALRDQTSHFWMGPWVTHTYTDSARLCWVSGNDDPAGHVELSGGKGAGTFTATFREITRIDGYVLQEVQLEGLEPYTRYEYTATCNGHTRTGSFMTMRPAGSREPVRFAVYGDTQDRPEFHVQTAPVIAASKPDFVIHTGDLIGKGDYWPQWKSQFFDPGMPVLSSASIWPTVGNHDSFMYYDPFFRGDGENYHTFTHGNVQVFIVASYRGGGEGSAYRNAQLDWLERELSQSKADWKILLTHYPMISVNTAHWVNWGQNDFRLLLEKHGVDFVLTGHEHIYRRFVPLGPEGAHPTVHITSGGGASVGGDLGHDGQGEPYYDEDHPLIPIAVRALHYLHFEIEGPRLVMEARLRDGSILDRIELKKVDGRYSNDVMDEAVDFMVALERLRKERPQD